MHFLNALAAPSLPGTGRFGYPRTGSSTHSGGLSQRSRNSTGRRASRATATDTQLELDVDIRFLSVVNVDQFYSIEIGEFPARIAATALWMMDHIMNNRLSLEFGQTYARIPIEKSPHIRNADALEIDWADVLGPGERSFVFGNPPFGGAKYQSPEQRAQVRRVAALGASGGTLDYVTPWFSCAGDYVRRAQPPDGAKPPRIGFVATNSITQGEQVAQLWPLLLDRRRLEIAFAHRTFAWRSDAPRQGSRPCGHHRTGRGGARAAGCTWRGCVTSAGG